MFQIVVNNKTLMPLSEEKQFALEVLDIFDELAKPEIKKRIIQQIWYGIEILHFPGVYKWMQGLIIKKSDEELNQKMLIIYKKLNSRFKNLETSIEINVMEKLNPGVRIPNVGELGKTKKLITISPEQMKQLEKELFNVRV